MGSEYFTTQFVMIFNCFQPAEVKLYNILLWTEFLTYIKQLHHYDLLLWT